MRPWFALLLALLALSSSSCTLIGAGMALGLSQEYPRRHVDPSLVWTSPADERVDLVLWNGQRVEGAIVGVSYAPEDSYRVAFERTMAGVPALDESVSVRLLGDRTLRGRFHGFDGNALLLDGGRAPDLRWVEELRGESVVISGDALRRRASRGDVPSRSRLRLRSGSLFSTPEQVVPYERIAWVERPPAAHPEVLLPLLIGIATDVWIVSHADAWFRPLE